MSSMSKAIEPAEALSLQSLSTPTEHGIASRVLARNGGGNVFREKVNTNKAAPGLATRAASPSAPRKVATEGARFQMPCAITKSAPSSSRARWRRR